MWVTTPCVRSCFPSDHDPGWSPSNSVDAQDTTSPSLMRRELPPFVFFVQWPPVVSGWMVPFSQAGNLSLASSWPSKIGALTPGVSVPPRTAIATSGGFTPPRTGTPTSGLVFRRDNMPPGCAGADWYSIMLTLVAPGMDLFAGRALAVRAVRLCG